MLISGIGARLTPPPYRSVGDYATLRFLPCGVIRRSWWIGLGTYLPSMVPYALRISLRIHPHDCAGEIVPAR